MYNFPFCADIGFFNRSAVLFWIGFEHPFLQECEHLHLLSPLENPLMETPIFGYLNASHVYTLLIYNFLIVVYNKHLIPPTERLTQIS